MKTLIKAVEKAGYKAEIEIERDVDREKELREKEIKSLKDFFYYISYIELTSIFSYVLPYGRNR